MKSSLILAAAGALTASAALADDGASFVNGDWVGTGAFQIGDQISACSEVKMRFEGSKTTYVVRQASMTCGNEPRQDFTDVAAFSIKEDGQIYFEEGTNTTRAKGTKVGVVKDNKLRTVSTVDTGGVNDISIEKAGDFLLYNETAGVPGATPTYSLLAIMKKDQSAAKP